MLYFVSAGTVRDVLGFAMLVPGGRSGQNVPELKVGQYAQISALDILSKAWLAICLLSLHLCYRSWRHSLQAVLVQEPISFADLPTEDAAERLFDAANAHNKRAKVGC